MYQKDSFGVFINTHNVLKPHYNIIIGFKSHKCTNTKSSGTFVTKFTWLKLKTDQLNSHKLNCYIHKCMLCLHPCHIIVKASGQSIATTDFFFYSPVGVENWNVWCWGTTFAWQAHFLFRIYVTN